MRKSTVIYYSQNGTTKKIADAIAERYGSDVVSVEPRDAYGSYFSSILRAGKELLAKDYIEVTTLPADLEDVEVVFVGFPIWYGDMPKFVKDYLVKCKLGERIVVPFATSGANGIDKAVKTLRTIAPQARIRRPFISSKKEKGDLVRWLEGLDVQMTKV